MRCFFVGHRDASSSVLEKLRAEVERHICQLGVTDFVVGQYGAFDHMAANAVAAAKRTHPEITLGILLAYHPAERDVCPVTEYDYTVYPPEMERMPKRFAIIRADQYMIKNSDYLITYAWKRGSNAYKLLEYAQKQKIVRITELALVHSD